MIERYLVQASSYAADIDGLIVLIGWIVGVWFVVAEGVFFYLIFRYRHRDGRKGEYITGEEKHQKRWITIPHCARAGLRHLHHRRRGARLVRRQAGPPARGRRPCGSSAQQWAWTLRAPGSRRAARHRRRHQDRRRAARRGGQDLPLQLESRDVLHDFSVPVFRLKQDAIPGRVITGWCEGHQDRRVRHPVRGDLRHRPRADVRADPHRVARGARGLDAGEHAGDVARGARRARRPGAGRSHG